MKPQVTVSRTLASGLMSIPLGLSGAATCILVLVGACTMVGGCGEPAEMGMPIQPSSAEEKSSGLATVPLLVAVQAILSVGLVVASAILARGLQRRLNARSQREQGVLVNSLHGPSAPRLSHAARISARKDRFSSGFIGIPRKARLPV